MFIKLITVNKRVETRALPELEEKRNNLIEEMESLLNKAKEETRAFNEDETKRYEEIKDEIRQIDLTLKADEDKLSFEKREIKDKKEQRDSKEIINEELRGLFEGRAAMNTGTNTEGGFVVNSELVQEIIKELKDRSDVYSFFDGTTIAGNTKIPKKTSAGTANWVDEENDSDDSSIPNLELIELGQHRLYRESALTQQMINSQEIDLKSFVIDDISESMIDAIENSIFNGTGTKQPTGIIKGITKKVSLETRGDIDFDYFKKCKNKLKKSAWAKAKWFMNADTLLALDLLKDSMGRPMLQPDLTSPTGYVILGIPVEVTDAMPTIQDAGAKCLVVLATPNAYHTNTQKSMAMYIYNDSAFTRKGLVGYASDIYLDGKTKNVDQLAGIFNIA